MSYQPHHRRLRPGHTLMEMMVASVASAVLLVGLGSVMMIGRQVAYTPANANRRIEAAEVVNQIAEELRHATLIIEESPEVLEFVVADRDNDGVAEKIRYEWSGNPNTPLFKSSGGNPAQVVLDAVQQFSCTVAQSAETTTLKSTVESAEDVLLATPGAVQNHAELGITATNHHAQQINPDLFPASVNGISKSSAVGWNATRFEFYGLRNGTATETLLVQFRSCGELNDAPTSNVVSQISVPENELGVSAAWKTCSFPNTVRGLSFLRRYAVVFASSGGSAAKLVTNELYPTGMFETTDAGATWPYCATRLMYGRLYGTYTTPGPDYTVTRNYASHVRIALRTGEGAHSRVDASVPLLNAPELVTYHWRADFDRNPTTSNDNGDTVPDWAMASGTFDTSKLSGGFWQATGAIETRPLCDFTSNTIVEFRCRNISTGGNGAVLRINADRQGGLHAPLLVHVRKQSDGTQNVSLIGKSSDAASDAICTRTRLSDDFVRIRLIIVPQSNVVNFQINDEDQGTFTYPTYSPSNSTDRFLTLHSDSSLAEFDYIDVRSY